MKDHQEAAEAYRSAAIENAPPIKIVRMLYQGAIQYLTRAEQLDPHDPNSGFVNWVNKSVDIVCELRLALDHEHNTAVSADLDALYQFIEAELLKACLERDAKQLAGPKRVLSTLLDAWKNVELETAGPA